MYLTHYCRIDGPAQLVDRVRQSVRDLAAIALAEEANADTGRQGRIKTAITEHLLNDVRRHGCTLTEARVTELLEVDLELNAQGLEVWLKRRARRAG
jgi:anti-sigma regulatory factor (Ser/Thr protein kinase)